MTADESSDKNDVPMNATTNSNGSEESEARDKNITTVKSKEEREHLEQVCDSFRQYATFTRFARAGQNSRISNLSPTQGQFLPRSMIAGTEEAKAREDAMQEAELRNQYFFDSMLRHAGLPHSQDMAAGNKNINSKDSTGAGDTSNGKTSSTAGNNVIWSTDDTVEKAHSVLKSLARDWSKDGAAERAMTYSPILDGIKRLVRLTYDDDTGISLPSRVLVPGAGVGRLALEIFSLGYEVQGNEFSLHMLLASDFILNGTSAAKPYAISPWFSADRNVCRADDPTRKVHVPDIDPASAMAEDYRKNDQRLNQQPRTTHQQQPDFSMAAGEFVSIYSKPEEHKRWNAVVSCFFLDTAPCLVEYLQVMYNLLADDGVLINFGPLHYHWSGPPYRPDDGSFTDYANRHSHLDRRYLQSVSMTWEDIREVLWRVGFELVEEKLGIKARYTADARSFINSDYRCIYFVAKKGTPKPRVESTDS